jgi:putative SOS response-associated peptidase YedK
VRNRPDGVRELMLAHGGMPSTALAIRDKKTDPGATNVRNVTLPHWRRWLGVESRCVVPFTGFAENKLQPDGSRPPVWFALDKDPAARFSAGIRTRWTSIRKVKEGETTNTLFAILTTEPNAIVAPIHPKAKTVDAAGRTRAVARGAGGRGAEASAAVARRRAAHSRARGEKEDLAPVAK